MGLGFLAGLEISPTETVEGVDVFGILFEKKKINSDGLFPIVGDGGVDSGWGVVGHIWDIY